MNLSPLASYGVLVENKCLESYRWIGFKFLYFFAAARYVVIVFIFIPFYTNIILAVRFIASFAVMLPPYENQVSIR